MRPVRDGQAADWTAILVGDVDNRLKQNSVIDNPEPRQRRAGGRQRHDLGPVNRSKRTQMFGAVTVGGGIGFDIRSPVANAPENIRRIERRLAQPRRKAARQAHRAGWQRDIGQMRVGP